MSKWRPEVHAVWFLLLSILVFETVSHCTWSFIPSSPVLRLLKCTAITGFSVDAGDPSILSFFCLCGRYLLPKPSSQAQVWILLLSYMLESKTTLPPLKVLLSWEWLLFLACQTYNGPLECILCIFFCSWKWESARKQCLRENTEASVTGVCVFLLFLLPLTFDPTCKRALYCPLIYCSAKGRIQIWGWDIEKKEIFAG